jgi:hypothetical protein
MAISAELAHDSPYVSTRSQAIERRTFKPVTVLAATGLASTVLEAYVIIKWISRPNFKTTPVGPSAVPEYMKVGLTALTVVGIAMWLFCMWKFLVQPWRREGHITLDGMFAIAFVLAYWLDPYADMVVPQFTYNSWLINRGNWLNDTPLVVMAKAHNIPEPYLLAGPIYLWCIFGVIVVANRVMKRAENRFPRMGAFGLISMTVGALSPWT